MIACSPATEVLCVVCPCFNEEEVIERFYLALTDVLRDLDDVEYYIHFVDDGSSDATLQRLNAIAGADDRVRVFSLSRNFGHQIALSAGLDTAAGDAVLMMDSDLQHPPELIPRMIELWREGHDVVSTVRRATEDSSLLKRLTSSGFYFLINRFGDTPIVPNAADFCLLSRRALEALRSMPERHRFLRGMISWIGYPRTFIEFEAPARAAGVSKYSMRKMLALALDATISFSTAPIKLARSVGAATVVAGLCYLVYVLCKAMFVGGVVLGWPSLICTILILGGVQLTFTGLIGEYLVRVFDETKQRPLYFFKQRPGDVPFTVATRANGRELAAKS